MNETSEIYGLCDPRSGALRYVGRAVNARARFFHHVHQTGRSDKKQRWIQELLSAGTKPDQFVIETVAATEAKESESFWIAYFNGVGASLLNYTRAEISALRAAGTSRRYRNPAERSKTANATRQRYETDPDARGRTREATKAARSTPDSRAKTAAQMQRRWLDPEEHRKHSERITKWWAQRKLTGGSRD